MTQSQAYGLLVILGIVVVMYVRAQYVNGWQAFVFTLFGFTLALTAPGYVVIWLLHWVFGLFN